MQQMTEHKWNPVNLQEGVSSKQGYQINSYAASSSWYNKQLQNDGTRLTRLRRYDEADYTSIEISKALDTIAEDVSSCNADDQDIIYLDYPDDTKVKKTTMKIAKEMLELWDERTLTSENLFEWARYTLKNGSKFFRKNKDGTLKHLPTERMIGYVLSKDDESKVTHYIYDPEGPLIDRYNNNKTSSYMYSPSTANKTDKYEFLSIDDLLILKVGDGPFGESIIEKVYRVWKQMTLVEDAVLIYRVVRAPERRIYYVDVGNLQGPKREQAIEKQRLRLMQKQASKGNSQNVASEYDPHSTGEDIFIPTNSSGKGSRVETLPPGGNVGEIGDLKWFANKMAAGLRVPKSLTDVHSDEDRDQFNDARVGSIYQTEMRYMGMVNRYKKAFIKVFEKNFRDFCKDRDFVIPEDAEFKITESQSFSLYKEMELNQTALNIFNSTLQIDSLSKKFALQKYLNFDQEEIRINEDSKLREMGLDDKTIKDMPQEHRDNLVYGDAHVGSEYGIEASGGGGGMF